MRGQRKTSLSKRFVVQFFFGLCENKVKLSWVKSLDDNDGVVLRNLLQKIERLVPYIIVSGMLAVSWPSCRGIGKFCAYVPWYSYVVLNFDFKRTKIFLMTPLMHVWENDLLLLCIKGNM